MLTTTVYAGLFLAAMYLAIIRGDKVERQVGTVLLIGNLATLSVVALFDAHKFTHVSEFYVAVDGICAILLCWLAVNRPSWMVILVAAFQINGTLAHLVKLLSPDTITISYAFLLRAWGWPMLVVLLVAHWRTTLRRPLVQSDLQGVPAPFGTRPLFQAPRPLAIEASGPARDRKDFHHDRSEESLSSAPAEKAA